MLCKAIVLQQKWRAIYKASATHMSNVRKYVTTMSTRVLTYVTSICRDAILSELQARTPATLVS